MEIIMIVLSFTLVTFLSLLLISLFQKSSPGKEANRELDKIVAETMKNPGENKEGEADAADYAIRKKNLEDRGALSPKYTEAPVAEIKREQKDITDRMPEEIKGWDKWKNRFRNLTRNVPRNVYENTVGNVLAGVENWRTRRDLKKNPNKEILHLGHGYFQKRGSMRQLARQARKDGYAPHLIKFNHEHQSRDWNKDSFYQQVDALHQKTGLTGEQRTNRDHFLGHSEGANVAIYAAQDPRREKYGIGKFYAVEPSPSGMELSNLDQKATELIAKAAGVTLDKDDLNSPQARKEALKLYSKEPYGDAEVYVVAGEKSGLVPPKDTVYKHAKAHYILHHPDATHFGDSGQHRDVNDMLLRVVKHTKEAGKHPQHTYDRIEEEKEQKYRKAA